MSLRSVFSIGLWGEDLLINEVESLDSSGSASSVNWAFISWAV